MMHFSPSRRLGRPLPVLAAILAIWVGGRVMLWESPFPAVDQLTEWPRLIARGEPVVREAAEVNDASTAQLPESHAPGPAPWLKPLAYADGAMVVAPFYQAHGSRLPGSAPSSGQSTTTSLKGGETIGSAVTQNLLWMAGMAHLSPALLTDANLDRYFGQAPPTPLARVPFPAGADVRSPNRFSLEGWLFLRPNAGSGVAGRTQTGGPAPSYGASQAGGILTYRLRPDSPHKPRLYVRAAGALEQPGDRHIAAGLSLRPLSDLPLRVQAEGRVETGSQDKRLRPAGFVVTELPPLKLPGGLRAEAYGQAGYVGGRDATGFADGQLRLDKEVATREAGQVRIGGAAWAGAQKGVHRLDIGPSARLDLRIGAGQARLDVDYRHRISGDAQPPSGAAITLSTAF